MGLLKDLEGSCYLTLLNISTRRCRQGKPTTSFACAACWNRRCCCKQCLRGALTCKRHSSSTDKILKQIATELGGTWGCSTGSGRYIWATYVTLDTEKLERPAEKHINRLQARRSAYALVSAAMRCRKWPCPYQDQEGNQGAGTVGLHRS